MKNVMFSVFLAVLLIQFTPVTAQTKVADESEFTRNSIYLNAIGNGSIISLNYDRLYFSENGTLFSTKIGTGINSNFLNTICWSGPCENTTPERTYLTLPVHQTVLLGDGEAFVEMGMGSTIVIGDTNEHIFLYPILGFRFQRLIKRGLNFRLYLSWPAGGIQDKDILFMPFGSSIGYRF